MPVWMSADPPATTHDGVSRWRGAVHHVEQRPGLAVPIMAARIHQSGLPSLTTWSAALMLRSANASCARSAVPAIDVCRRSVEVGTQLGQAFAESGQSGRSVRRTAGGEADERALITKSRSFSKASVCDASSRSACAADDHSELRVAHVAAPASQACCHQVVGVR